MSQKEDEPPRQHGVKGVYHAGDWLDIEDCAGTFTELSGCSDGRLCDPKAPCPRSMSRPTTAAPTPPGGGGGGGEAGQVTYDVLVVGAGCVGAAIARELSKYDCKVLWVEAADDVSQGATKGNSGIVHAGYDDEPGSVRAKYCWRGNQMFPQLDRELRFGYQKNGSLVVAFDDKERKVLRELLARGKKNGVQRLRVVGKDELVKMEPHVNPKAVEALHSPDAGNVIPYEFAVALAENAVDNGVELRIRRVLIDLKTSTDEGGAFEAKLQYWEPGDYLKALQKSGKAQVYVTAILMLGCVVFLHYLAVRNGVTSVSLFPFVDAENTSGNIHMVVMAALYVAIKVIRRFFSKREVSRNTPIADLVKRAGRPVGSDGDGPVKVDDMLIGGSGSVHVMKGSSVTKEVVRCRYVVNCAGGAADRIAGLVGDASVRIKPRVGDYILLNRNQVRMAAEAAVAV